MSAFTAPLIIFLIEIKLFERYSAAEQIMLTRGELASCIQNMVLKFESNYCQLLMKLSKRGSTMSVLSSTEDDL